MKRFDTYLGRIAAAAVLLLTGGFLSSCDKNDEGPKLDKITVTVSEVSATATTAVFVGVVERQAKAPADAIVGFEYSNSEDLSGAVEVTGLAEQFTEKVTGLSINTKYYYRTLVEKSGDRTYGKVESFTTNTVSASVDAVATTSTTATIICSVDPEAVGKAFKAGVEISAYETFDAVQDISAETVSDKGEYTISVEGFALNTIYYVRAYLENNGSRTYGVAKAFATTGVVFNLNVVLETALLRVFGNVVMEEADKDVLKVGYQVSTDPEFSEAATTSVEIPASQYGNYDSGTLFNRRRPSTNYYYRSYVVYEGQYLYNNISKHTTDALVVKGYNILPGTISAKSASALPSVDGWDLTGIDEMGVAYSTSADFLTTGAGISYSAMQEDPFFGGYALALTGLTPATGYYYTYYIKRGSEYEYGPAESVLSFATKPDASCVSVNQVNPESYTPGKVIFTGSSKVSDLARSSYAITTSLEYATKEDFSDKVVKGFTGNLSFQKNDLKPATTYYYRIALTYNDGKGEKTLYSDAKSFTTNEIVVNIGAASSNVKETSIKFGIAFDYSMWDRSDIVTGVILTTDPACELTSEGVMINESYDVEDPFGFGTMTMLKDFTGLESGTKYYYRSFIKRGEEYKLGAIKSIYTLGPTPAYVAVTDMLDGRLVIDLNVNYDNASKFNIGIEYAFDSNFTDGAKKMDINRSSDNQSQSAQYRKQLSINMPSIDVYYRFYYAKVGTTDYVYSDTKKFRMLDLTESKIVPTASGITANSVTVSGALNTGSYSVTKLSIGVLCAPSADPTMETAGVVSSPMKVDLDWFTFSYVLAPTTLSGLTSGTTYYYRIYYKVGETYVYLPAHSFETVAGPKTVNISQADLFTFGTNTSASSPKTLTFSGVDLEVASSGGGTDAKTYYILLNGSTPYIKIKAPKPITSVVLDKITCTSSNVGESTPCVVGIYSSIGVSPVMLDSYSISTKGESHKVEFTLDGTVDEVYVQASLKSQVTGISVTY